MLPSGEGEKKRWERTHVPYVFSPRKGGLAVRRVVGEGVADSKAGLFVQQAATKQALPPESDLSGFHGARRVQEITTETTRRDILKFWV